MAFFLKKCLSLLLIATFALSLTACNTTVYDNSLNVVEATALTAKLNDSSVVIIDARSADDYAKGHLQGAISLTPQELSISDPVIGLVAPQEKIESVLSAKGIDSSMSIYIYDNNGGINAGRIWWVLKLYGHENVAIINGGEAGVLKAALPLTLDVPSTTAKTYSAKSPDMSMIAMDEEVLNVINGTSTAKLIDVRSQAEYDEGFIATAILYPHTKNFYNDGMLKSARDLAIDYRDLGFKETDAIILYCKTSFRATPVALALREAGFSNVKVYDGAWIEWQFKGHPVEVPEGAVVPKGGDGS